MNDDGNVAAVGGAKDIFFLTISGMTIHQWTILAPGLLIEGDHSNVRDGTEPPLLIPKNHNLISTKP